MSSLQSSSLSQESPTASEHPDTSHDAGDVTNRLEPVDLTPFPSLTGLRPTNTDGTGIRVVKVLDFAFVDLQNAACLSDLSERVLLQAAWANLLSVYTGSLDVTFLSASPISKSAPQQESHRFHAHHFRITDGGGTASTAGPSPAHPPLNKFHHERSPAQDSLQLGKGSFLDLEHLEGRNTQLRENGLVQEDAATFGRRCAVCLTIWTEEGGVLHAELSSTTVYVNHQTASQILDQFEHALVSHVWHHPHALFPHSWQDSLGANAQRSESDSVAHSPILEIPCEPLHFQFESFADTAPDQLAINYIFGLQSDKSVLWSYRVLNQKANAFACHLQQAHNVRNNAIIPICMDRCPELYVAILGILKAGAAWCPIDPSFPARRRCQLVDRTNAQIVVVNEGSPRDGFSDSVTLVSICHSQSDEGQWKAPKIGPDNLAYLVWTSGTTGEPKGVPIHHRAAITSMRALQNAVPAQTRNGKPLRCLQFSQFTFDVFVQDLFYTWGSGGTLVCSDRATMLGSFAALANASGATHAHLTPAFAASVPRASCPTLEVVTMIGEKLTQSVADDWSRDMQLFNTYGPAETTVVSSLRRVPHHDTWQSANVGYPLPSVSIFVMRNHRPVGKNCIGELALAGPQLSKGYWRDPERTQSRFVFDEYLKTILYMTGDTVRLLFDGSLEFVGRTDDLVKIQGIRIELSEISYALGKCHPMVQQIEVALLDRPDRPSKVLVAFLAVQSLHSEKRVVFNAEAADIVRAALQEARATLPEYMIPKVFLVVGQIPRTSSAKIDRTRLANLYADADLGEWERILSREKEGRSDWTEPENSILDVVADITGTLQSSIRRESALTSIGIDSIAATRLVTKLSGVSLAEVLQCRTFGDLLAASLNQSHNEREFGLGRLQHELMACLDTASAERASLVAPCLPLQEALLVETFRDASSYWSNNFFHIDADADLSLLREAWLDVAMNTDALRLSFVSTEELSRKPSVDAAFLQLISKNPTIDFVSIETSQQLLEAQAKQRAREIATHWQGVNFKGAPWAITVFTLGGNRVMMVTIHHSVCDELSIRYLVNDVHYAYHKPSNGRESPRRNQFGSALDTLLREKSTLDSDFWTNALTEFQDSDEQKIWPSLKSNNKSSAGSITRTWQLQQSYQNLQDRAIKVGASSVVSILRLIWAYVLHEYLETDRVVFGETWSARGEASGHLDVVGPMLYTVPTPVEISGTVREAVKRLDEFHFHARQHLNFHPRDLRRMLGYSRSRILYPAILNFIPESSNDQDKWLRADDVVGLCVEHPVALNAMLSSSRQVLTFELVADRQHMDGEHLQIISHQIDALLDVVLHNPDTPLQLLSSHLPTSLLSIAESSYREARNVQNESPIHWIKYYEELHPDWPAVEAVSLEGERLTSKKWSYRELRRAYTSVMKVIDDSGFHQRLIGVCLEHSLEVHAVILGIMASNNVYLPIAQDLPADRKRFLLTDSNAAMLFTSRTCEDSFPPGCEIRYVEDLDHSSPVPPFISCTSPSARDGAYLLYTSGSTGAPKGVHVGRGNLVSFIEAVSAFICRHLDMTQLQGRGKYLGMASYAFDVHLLEMFFAWRHGMTTVSAPRSILLDDLEAVLQKFKITHASFVPSLVDSAGISPSTLPDLRYMSVGGEMITQKVITTWANSHVVLVNAYGPTEATIGCCFKRVTTDMNVRNIGTPLAYTTAHVLQPESSHYALRNTPGELCLTGALVANGYFHRPDAKGFVDDFNGQKMYRTGDRVRLMANGSLEFLGRKDDQTKIRGQRIELGEVSEAVRSAVLAVFPQRSVEAASLVSQHPTLTRPQLVAFIARGKLAEMGTGSEDVSIEESEDASAVEAMRDLCRAKLPAYMVPDHMVFLNQLPLAKISRKVDVKTLALLFSEMSLGKTDSTLPLSRKSNMPLSSDQRDVCAVVEKTLALDAKNLQITSNLFSFGLDSLNAIALTVGLHKANFRCTVSDVLRNPSIDQLARLPRSQEVSMSQVEGVDLRTKLAGINGWQAHDSDILCVRKCLPLQETLIASSLDESGVALYINHVVFRLSSQIDLERLIRAWELTLSHHEIMRTCFAEIDNRFVQVVLRQRPLSCCRHATVAPESPLDRLSAERPVIAADILAKIFTDPPLRLNIAISDTASFLQISVHHALYDAQSFSMILDEVHARYLGSEPRVCTSVDSLLDYISAQDGRKAEVYWQRCLHNYKPTLFDTKGDSHQTISVTRKLCLPYSKVEQLAMSLNSTSASITQAVFGVALAQTLGKADIVFGAVLSGRTIPIPGAASIVAPCITTIPQRVTITRDSLETTVRSAHDGFVDSLEHQFSALRDVHRWVKADGPLFDSLFTYTKTQRSIPDLWQEVESSMSSGFPLAVEVEVGAGDEISFRCDTVRGASFASDFLDRMVSLVQSLLNKEQLSLQQGMSLDQGSPVHKTGSSRHDHEIRCIVADLIGRSSDEISSETSFFTLGIDSILAIQLVKRLRQAGITCSTADVMRNASIERLSQHLTQTGSGTSSGYAHPTSGSFEKSLVPVSPLTAADVITKRYHCTPLQSSMLTRTLGSEDQLYVHQHCIRLDADVDKIKLRVSWDVLVKGLEILRTSFHFDEGESSWTAAVHRDVPDQWHLEDYDNLTDALSSIRSDFSFDDEANFCQPPWRIDLFHNVLVLSLHHALYDGEALHLLFRHLADVYNSGEFDPAPPFSQAADMIHANHKQAETFWLQSLEGFKPIKRHSLRTRLRQITQHLTLDLPWVLASCKEQGVTLQAVALLAFGQTLAQDYGSCDVVFGHVVRGRGLAMPSVDEIVGPLFNTTPFRIDPDVLNRSYGDAVQRVQTFVVASQSHQHASLPRIQQAWQEKSRNESELIDDIFVFQKESEGSASDLPWTPVDLTDERDSTEHSLNFEVEQGTKTIAVSANSTKGTDLQQFVKHFESNVYRILVFPDDSCMDMVPDGQSEHSDMAQSSVNEESSSSDSQLLDQLRDALSAASHVSAKEISDQTSIKSLGLDSISAIKMVSSSRKKGLKISVVDVIQGRTLLGIAARIAQKKKTRLWPDPPRIDVFSEEERQRVLKASGIRAEDVEEIFPCLAGQDYHLRRWLKSGGTMSEAAWTLRATQRLDRDRMLKAWRSLRARHGILRTVFTSLSSEMTAQIILKPSALRSDAFSSVEVPNEETLFWAIKLQSEHRFDLFNPPCALTIFNVQGFDVVLLRIHHALYDALTLPILIRDLDLLYRGQPLKDAPSTAEVHGCIRDRDLERSRLFWTHSLRDCEQTLLRSGLKGASGFFFSKQAVPSLRLMETRCKEQGVSLASMIIIAFGKTLARLTSVSNPVMGLFHAGRSTLDASTESQSLPLLSVSPLAIRNVDSPNIKELLQSMDNELEERMPFEQDYLGSILEYAPCCEKPLFNALLNIHMYQGHEVSWEEQILQHWTLPGPAILSLSKMHGRTAVDSLSTEMLSESTFFLDVEVLSRSDLVRLTARSDRQACSEEDCKSLLEDIALQLDGVVQILGPHD